MGNGGSRGRPVIDLTRGTDATPTWLARVVRVAAGEAPALAWSFVYFFALLCGYYVLRPVRDEMGISGGVDKLHWVFTATFLTMLAAVPLFGAASARLRRRRLVPAVYLFFIANLLIFFVLFRVLGEHGWLARGFFVWTSVFNLFVVSVFWSFMADIFTNDQGRRLFGMIAAGGSLGAVLGPALTGLLAEPLGTSNLLLLSALILGLALIAVIRLVAHADGRGQGAPADNRPLGGDDRPLGGGIADGFRLALADRYLLGICLFIWLHSGLATVLYFEQANILADAFDRPETRTALFAWMDFAVNAITLTTQLFLTGRLIRRLGVDRALALMPATLAVGLVVLAAAPAVAAVVVVQVLRRAGNFAITQPAREILFTVVGREAKYKAKNFIDTVVYRGGDAVSGWAFAGLKGLGLSLSAIALMALPLALIWAWNGLRLGRRQEGLAEAQRSAIDSRLMDI